MRLINNHIQQGFLLRIAVYLSLGLYDDTVTKISSCYVTPVAMLVLLTVHCFVSPYSKYLRFYSSLYKVCQR